MWEKVKLGEACDIIGGFAFKSDQYTSNEIPLVRISNILENRIILDKECSIDENPKYRQYEIINGDILVALSGATTGKFGVFNLQEKAYLNQRVALIRKLKGTNQKYIFYYLNQIKGEILMKAGGAAQPNISTNELGNFVIPFPPLPIQEKIANILDKADELRRKDKELQAKYDELAQAIFIDMFGDPVKNEKGWMIHSFNYFVDFDTKMTSDFEKYKDVPHIGIGNILKDSGELVNYKLVREEKLESGKYIFTKEHIIYSKIRPNLNKVALPNFIGLASADSYPLRPTKNSNRIFFSHLLRSNHFLDFISGFSNRANIPKVNKSQLSKYQGICPPVNLQNEFARKIELINALKAQTNAEKSEELFQSLLQKAFKGELVSKKLQANYESTSN